jgi:hypothetical protein
MAGREFTQEEKDKEQAKREAERQRFLAFMNPFPRVTSPNSIHEGIQTSLGPNNIKDVIRAMKR